MDNVNLNGRADKLGFKKSDVIPKEHARGKIVEMEHTDDPAIAEKIEMDHEAEFKKYYSALDLMEKFLKGINNLPEDKQDALLKALDTQIGIILRSAETMGKILNLNLFTTASKR
jgi:hypothetical protein